ncbi:MULTISPECIES: helix-turn-helix domain-containing protein [Methylobacterium]|uniref:Uncharacterized protein n=1 Tax=Methylobacterium iners TaxID=418707 RepID=A0ABQ4S605_9HYPH|nr:MULTISPECIES: helix-turn-helix domain-containing protein [Methylobacterium]GJD37556.1 hypothetical protein FMGBMHLM_4491 [Methylobacterium aerolatum]GJD97304.1 hypothetical protein OCOJLMKI_4533 [Methylobacterium iners]
MFADEIRRAVEAAPRVKLPEVAALLWRAFGDGQVSEAEAATLSNLIEARKAVPIPVRAFRKAVGSRPRTDASMERRRRWAASGRLPPALAARFTLAEAAVLAVVSSEVVKRGDCRLCLDHIAALAGVSRSTVKNALRQARTLGLLTVEERTQTAWRNLSNVVRIVSKEWTAWMRLARRAAPWGGGVKSVTRTNTERLELRGNRPAEPKKKLPERQDRLQGSG